MDVPVDLCAPFELGIGLWEEEMGYEGRGEDADHLVGCCCDDDFVDVEVEGLEVEVGLNGVGELCEEWDATKRGWIQHVELLSMLQHQVDSRADLRLSCFPVCCEVVL